MAKRKPLRRSERETVNPGYGGDPLNSRVMNDSAMEKAAEVAKRTGKPGMVRANNDMVLTPLKGSNHSGITTKSEVSKHDSRYLHEKGKVNELRGKGEDKIAKLGEDSWDQPIGRDRPKDDMVWENQNSQKEEPVFEFIMVPKPRGLE